MGMKDGKGFGLVVCLAGALACGSCGSDEARERPTVLAPELVVADQGFASDAWVYPDRIEIATAGHEATIAKLHAGSIFAAAFSTAHPDRNPAGFLRRVVGIAGGETTVITTTEASLADAIIDGQLVIHTNAANAFDEPQEISTLGVPKPGGFTANIPDMDLVDSNGTLGYGRGYATGSQQLTLRGMSIRLAPDFDMDLKVDWWQRAIADFHTSFTMGYEAKGTIYGKFEGGIGATVYKPFQKKNGDPPWKKETKIGLVFISGLPVVYQWVFSIEPECTITVSSSTEMELGWHLYGEPTLGVKYSYGSWSQVGSPTDFNIDTNLDVKREGKLTGECYFPLKVHLKLYGTGGPFVAAGPGLRASVGVTNCPPPDDWFWTVDAFGQLRLGGEAKIDLWRFKQDLGSFYTAYDFLTFPLWPRGGREEKMCEPPAAPIVDAGLQDAEPVPVRPPMTLVDSCAGREDGIYCSEVTSFSAIVCKGESIAYGLQCANEAKCLGPNGPGTTIVCEGAPPPPNGGGGNDAGGPVGDTCAGRPDGVYCSVNVPGTGYRCKDGSTAGGLFCESGKMCVGPNGPGDDIQCQ